MTDTKPRDVQVASLGAGTLVLRSRTWDRLKFEVEYAQQKGTTANSFLIQADKTALFDPPGESFTDIYLDELYHHVYFQKIDYVILGHVNPNRFSTLKTMLGAEVASQIQFVCTRAAEVALRAAFADRQLQVLVVSSGDSIDLGQGHVLQFMPVPTPRHPDGLCTYDAATRILYTDKFFGTHVCDESVLDEHWKQLDGDRRYYFDCLHASQFRQVEAALDRLASFAAKMYAPGHGPMVSYSLSRLTYDYRQWCAQQQSQELNVALLFTSAYGNTAAMARAITHGLIQAGATVQSINCEFAEPREIADALEHCGGFIMGTPTLAGHPPTQMQTALGIALASADRTKLAGVFGSYGWSGEAVDLLQSKLEDAGYGFGFAPIRIKFSPTEEIVKTCENAGIEFVQALKRSQKNRAPRTVGIEIKTADRTEQAISRITGSLCVITTHRFDSDQALMTSWVSQATFTPPGLTIAVPMSHAEATLPTIGSQFVLNILKEGRNVRRYFLKPTMPGENRFAAIATHSATNGCLILDEALAFLECTVQNRMECGDHWLIYATVDNGKLLETVGVTAVQHRKSGTYY
jgi:flavorubredoxin/flavin reductase (DIM6/NTAB) family NADH-FMN oxidoreductase RutF